MFACAKALLRTHTHRKRIHRYLMDMFITLTVLMVSQVYAPIQINQIIYIKYVQFFVSYINISIKLIKNFIKKLKNPPTHKKIDNNFFRGLKTKIFSISNNNCIALYINREK